MGGINDNSFSGPNPRSPHFNVEVNPFGLLSPEAGKIPRWYKHAFNIEMGGAGEGRSNKHKMPFSFICPMYGLFRRPHFSKLLVCAQHTSCFWGMGGSDRCSDHQIEFGEKGAIVHCKNKFTLPLLPFKLNEEMQTGSETNLKQICQV